MRTAMLGAIAMLTILPAAAGSGGVIEAQIPVVRAVAPRFPELAAYARVEGEVQVVVRILTDGSVSAAEATSGPPFLRPAAEASARRWRFEPADGLERRSSITFLFHLAARDACDLDLLPVFTPPRQVEVRLRLQVVDSPPVQPKRCE